MLIQECLLREAPLRPSSVQLVEETSQGLDRTIRSVLLLIRRTGNIDLQDLPASIQAIPLRMPGYLDPEPPTSFLVNHRTWDEAFLATTMPGKTLGEFVSEIGRLVSTLAGSVVIVMMLAIFIKRGWARSSLSEPPEWYGDAFTV